MSDKYIYINENSLSPALCFDIIQLFEKEENKVIGQVSAGINKQIKDTIDHVIDSNDPKWYKYHQFLSDELNRNIQKYLKQLNPNDIINNNYQLSDLKYNLFDGKKLLIKFFLIQRYIKNTGRYIYHNDFNIDISNKKYRVFTFLWYLNDVHEGGETMFDGTISIKPTTGKLILFPASWTYPHCGKIPISNNKYILTGWIYVDI